MKATLIALVTIFVLAILWFFSHVLVFFALAALFFTGVGMVIGWRVNDWYETTRLHRWHVSRRNRKHERVAL